MALLALSAVALAGGTALAGDVVNSTITLEVNRAKAKFKGKVASPASDCVIGRKVLIYRRDPGRDTKVVKTFASESGKYVATIPMQHGKKLYSSVKRYTTPIDTICRGGRSPTVTG